MREGKCFGHLFHLEVVNSLIEVSCLVHHRFHQIDQLILSEVQVTILLKHRVSQPLVLIQEIYHSRVVAFEVLLIETLLLGKIDLNPAAKPA